MIFQQESPVLILPPPPTSSLFFLTLPQKALEAIFLLHNTTPDKKAMSSVLNIPKHRLLDYLNGILSTNCFGATSNFYGKLGVILLRASLFNHSSNPNVMRRWIDGL